MAVFVDSDEEEDHPAGKVLLTIPKVDSKLSPLSRPSLLSAELHASDRQAGFAEVAQAQPVSPKEKTKDSMDSQKSMDLNPDTERSNPVNIVSPNEDTTPNAFSPRTTRQNMLAAEMSEKIREAILLERKDKRTTIDAVQRRTHPGPDSTEIWEEVLSTLLNQPTW